MWQQQTITISTPGRGLCDITDKVQRFIDHAGAGKIGTGLCHVFLCHTSASLILCENADPQVYEDLARFMSRLAPDGDSLFDHTMEGPDDMPAHVRSILTSNDLTIPVADGKLALGTWQGITLWEHRLRPHPRQLVLTVHGQ